MNDIVVKKRGQDYWLATCRIHGGFYGFHYTHSEAIHAADTHTQIHRYEHVIRDAQLALANLHRQDQS